MRERYHFVRGHASVYFRKARESVYASPVLVCEMTIAEFIDDLLKRKKLSERSLAMNVGVSTNAINAWHRGLRTPEPAFCRKLAEWAGVDAEDVLRMAGHLSDREAAEEPEMPSWLRQALPLLKELDDYEGRVVEETAQTLRELRELRSKYEAEE